LKGLVEELSSGCTGGEVHGVPGERVDSDYLPALQVQLDVV